MAEYREDVYENFSLMKELIGNTFGRYISPLFSTASETILNRIS